MPTIKNLDLFYHLERLSLINRFLLQQKVTQINAPDEIRNNFFEFSIPERYFEESVELLVNFRIFQLLTANSHSAEHYQSLAALLIQREHDLHQEIRKQFYTYLRNICVLAIKKGHTDLLPILHQLQKDNLEKGILYHDDNLLSSSAFISVTATALRTGQLNWTESFIEQHRERIIGDNETRDFYRLAKACLLFEQGRFEEALDFIPAASSFTDYHLIARRLELKSYFELDSELLPFKINAFRMFLSRASKKYIPDELRDTNSDFVNILQQIAQIPPGNPERIRRVTQRVLDRVSIAERDWLLDKLQKFK